MTWAELPVKLKIYIYSLSVFGTAIAAWAVWNLLANPHDSSWIVFAVLVVITVPFSLFLPSVSAAVGIGDAYIMAIAMMYGIAPCIIATFIQTFIISLFGQRKRRYNYRIVFNTSSSVCGAWLYATVYHLASSGSQWQDILVPAALLVATYFFVNSVLTSIAIAWSLGESITKYWAQACMPLAIDYSISALCAVFLVALKGFHQYYPLAAAPVILLIWIWNKYQQNRHIQTERHLKEQEQLYLQTVEALALAVDAKDQTTYGHIRRVRVYAKGLAKLRGIKDKKQLDAIETGSLLHDIGKIAIDDYILNKPGRLSKKEFEKMKQHSAAGDEILQQVKFPYPVAKYVRHHHERWDGTGYPDGLKGEEIPLGARILAIADAFDAIRFSRPYKLSVGAEEAKEILRAEAGKAFDPNLVLSFADHIDELEQTAIKESENATQLSFRKYAESTEDSSSISSVPAIAQDVPAELVKLAEFCGTIFGYLRLEDVLPVIAQRLQKIVPFTTCVFYLKTRDDLMRGFYATGNCSELLQGHTIEMGKGISGWVAAHGQAMMNTGPALDFQGIEGDFKAFTDALVVPIKHGDEPLGTVSLYACKPITYSQYQLNIVQTLAGFLAPLISEAEKHETSGDQNVVDPVTGLHHISYLTAIGPQLISMAAETRTTLSLIYIEIRNLGQITRIYGSNWAKSILRTIADGIKAELRETDIPVRFGHQGFVAFLPGVRDDQALRCIHRLKQQIKSEAITTVQGFAIDCRAGVAYYPKDGATVLSLLQSAQENMRSCGTETLSQENRVVDFHRT